MLRVFTSGGFVAPGVILRQVPEFTLTADGRVITVGPQIAIYPGPALPDLQVRVLTSAGVQAIIAAGRLAGLDGPDRRYDTQTISDAPTTTFTFVDHGRVHTIGVYALGMGEPAHGTKGTPDERNARRVLSALRDKLSDLGRWLPAGSVGAEKPYEPNEIRTYVQPYTSSPDLTERAISWPLRPPLASFGTQVSDRPGLRCGAVAGHDLITLRPLLGGANELTPWRSDGRDWSLVLRPLLPDESGC